MPALRWAAVPVVAGVLTVSVAVAVAAANEPALPPTPTPTAAPMPPDPTPAPTPPNPTPEPTATQEPTPPDPTPTPEPTPAPPIPPVPPVTGSVVNITTVNTVNTVTTVTTTTVNTNSTNTTSTSGGESESPRGGANGRVAHERFVIYLRGCGRTARRSPDAQREPVRYARVRLARNALLVVRVNGRRVAGYPPPLGRASPRPAGAPRPKRNVDDPPPVRARPDRPGLHPGIGPDRSAGLEPTPERERAAGTKSRAARSSGNSAISG